MSFSQDSQHTGTAKAKKGVVGNPPPRSAGPTTFFLRSEKEVENSMQRGRKSSREEDRAQKTPMSGTIGDSSFGVQSLENTIASSSASASDGESLSRTNSYASDASMEANAGAEVVSTIAGRKRKAGNPVHPKILATGQRILSADYAVRAGSPSSLHTTEYSPLRRRNSVSSSVNLSQPLTPLKMSPRPASALPSTPRSGSPKSFRLSDEEASIASDNGSQAIQSSSGDENEDEIDDKKSGSSMPQLVMPSLAMPARRPFTEKGKQMGRLKVMVVGQKGVGKTSLIQSLCRVCEDVVHLDSLSKLAGIEDLRCCGSTGHILEIGASTRPYPAWWTDFESRRMLLRRKGVGSDGVLERNLTFIDTPGFDNGPHGQQVLQHFKTSLSNLGNMARMHDSDLINLLSGEGGAQIDAVLYLFDPALAPEKPAQMDSVQAELLQYLCKWTNVIPLIGRADTVEAEVLRARKEQILHLFESLQAEPASIAHDSSETADGEGVPSEPYAISSAPTPPDELEGMDASLLMASGYIQPLVPSELPIFAERLLKPDNIARLRHLSATKFLLWRQENLGSHLNLQQQLVRRSSDVNQSPELTSTGSIPDEPSKLVIPHGSSNYFRSMSPSASDASALSGNGTALTNALALNTNSDLPFRQIRLAKWAQDLQRSLHNESKRYHQRIFARSPSPYDAESANLALTHTNTNANLNRPAKGHLGGEIAIFDPRDPLGVLAFSQTFRRRGWVVISSALRVGICYAVVWVVHRNWEDVREWLGFPGETVQMVHVNALPVPVAATSNSIPGVSNVFVRTWDGLAGWIEGWTGGGW